MNKLNLKHCLLVFLLSVFAAGCATTSASRKGFEFENYERIGVADFISYGKYGESGFAVADEFVRQLLRQDKEVVEIEDKKISTKGTAKILPSGYDVDAVLTGTVTRYEPDGRETVYFKDSDGEMVSKVFYHDARVGISAKLIDSDGEIVWSDNYSYSGFDIDHTVSNVVRVIVNRMQ
ncbi:MAG: hypothetical protein ACQEQC_05015 [Elusimicrobiota bacterium]